MSRDFGLEPYRDSRGTLGWVRADGDIEILTGTFRLERRPDGAWNVVAHKKGSPKFVLLCSLESVCAFEEGEGWAS